MEHPVVRQSRSGDHFDWFVRLCQRRKTRSSRKHILNVERLNVVVVFGALFGQICTVNADVLKFVAVFHVVC